MGPGSAARHCVTHRVRDTDDMITGELFVDSRAPDAAQRLFQRCAAGPGPM